MSEIGRYKVKIFVSEGVVFTSQSHKFDVTFWGEMIGELRHHLKATVEYIGLKYLLDGMTNDKYYDVGDLRRRVFSLDQSYKS